jgi:hypothetical protein
LNWAHKHGEIEMHRGFVDPGQIVHFDRARI